MDKDARTAAVLIAVTLLIALVPLLALKGAQFEGSDGAGSEMVEEVTGGEHEPWFEPVLETLIGGELPSEMETLLFCVQTGIGVGVIAYCFGYLVARKRYSAEGATEAGAQPHERQRPEESLA
ncbi:MAG: cobalt transport protein CbiN [Coriobacteriia bacterium]|nr:cobalt transport protein CbiN [Coriobacteriia bacterium]